VFRAAFIGDANKGDGSAFCKHCNNKPMPLAKSIGNAIVSIAVSSAPTNMRLGLRGGANNQVERCFNRLKQFRRIATRYEKRAENYLAMLTIASILLWV
jgi:hypothetical protein